MKETETTSQSALSRNIATHTDASRVPQCTPSRNHRTRRALKASPSPDQNRPNTKPKKKEKLHNAPVAQPPDEEASQSLPFPKKPPEHETPLQKK
jgi:hypothetical protein